MIIPLNTLDGLINLIYPNIATQAMLDNFFLDWTILATTNDVVDEINTSLLDLFPGQEATLLAFDLVVETGNPS
jgi:hypothetical protein